jgi:hypothetical protein
VTESPCITNVINFTIFIEIDEKVIKHLYENEDVANLHKKIEDLKVEVETHQSILNEIDEVIESLADNEQDALAVYNDDDVCAHIEGCLLTKFNIKLPPRANGRDFFLCDYCKKWYIVFPVANPNFLGSTHIVTAIQPHNQSKWRKNKRNFAVMLVNQFYVQFSLCRNERKISWIF